MSTNVIHLDAGLTYELTAHRSKCRCGSCPTEEISVTEVDTDPALNFSYNVKSDYGLDGIDLTDFQDIERLMSVLHHLTNSLGKSLKLVQELAPDLGKADLRRKVGAELVVFDGTHE